MATRDDIETYAVRMGLAYDEVEPGMWVVHEPGEDTMRIVVHLQPPVVVFRLKLMDVPAHGREALYRKLLELNATEMLGGAYGIEGDSIVCIETLQSENLDFNEFQAAIDGLTVAATEHYPVLRQYRDAEHEAPAAGPGGSHP